MIRIPAEVRPPLNPIIPAVFAFDLSLLRDTLTWRDFSQTYGSIANAATINACTEQTRQQAKSRLASPALFREDIAGRRSAAAGTGCPRKGEHGGCFVVFEELSGG
jgi:hypothetical protein